MGVQYPDREKIAWLQESLIILYSKLNLCPPEAIVVGKGPLGYGMTIWLGAEGFSLYPRNWRVIPVLLFQVVYIFPGARVSHNKVVLEVLFVYSETSLPGNPDLPLLSESFEGIISLTCMSNQRSRASSINTI